MKKNQQILLAIVAGISVGIFFGDLCGYLKPVSNAIRSFMQIAVIPYMILAVLTAILSMKVEQLKMVGKSGGTIIISLWLLFIALMMTVPFFLPYNISASFFAPKIAKAISDKELISLFVPENIFQSLSEGSVPAILIFCLLFGVAINRSSQSGTLQELLNAMYEAIDYMSSLITRIAPWAIFIFLAQTAGTLPLDQLIKLQVYFAFLLVLVLLVFLWIQPFLVSIVCRQSWKEFMSDSLPALMMVLSSGSTFIALPLIMQALRSGMQRSGLDKKETEMYADILMPVLFILPASGDLMHFIFIYFVAWSNKVTIDIGQQLQMFAIGIPYLFGSSRIMIQKVLSLLNLPIDASNLFDSAIPIVRHFTTTLNNQFFLVFCLITTSVLTGKKSVNKRYLIIYPLVSVALLVGVFMATKAILQPLVSESYNGYDIYERQLSDKQMDIIDKKISKTVWKTQEDINAIVPRDTNRDLLEQIRQTRVLRVGYNKDSLPFAFFNEAGELIGYDVDMARELADFLNCRYLEFVPVNYKTLPDLLASGKCDIVMSGIVMNEFLYSKVDFAMPYQQIDVAWVVPEKDKENFATWEKVLQNKLLKFAVVDGWVDINTLKGLSDYDDDFIEIEDPNVFFKQKGLADVFITSAQVGSAWTLKYPLYTVITFDVEKRFSAQYCAYPVNTKNSSNFMLLVNNFVTIAKDNGFTTNCYNYWMLGQGLVEKEDRWSVIKDVLHITE